MTRVREVLLPAPGLNAVVVVVQNPLDAFHVTPGLLSEELTANRRTDFKDEQIKNLY